MIFIPRLTVPEDGNPYYTRTGYGGLNPCIAGIPEAWTGSALANCVGYCTGRWYELLGRNPHLCPYDAKYWYTYPDGYQRGSEPKLGAIICFTSSGSGHVAVVEKINNSNAIVTSNSAYQQTIFYPQTLYRSNNWTWGNGYIFQGFIYLPDNYLSPKEIAILKKRREH